MAYKRNKLRYVGGGGSVDMSCAEANAGAALGVRGRAWGYDLGAHDASGLARLAREAELEVVFKSREAADRLATIADGDVQARKAGSLEIDGWSQRAYILKSEPSEVSRGHVRATLTVALLDGVWRTAETTSFSPASSVGETELDLPHDLPHDLAGPPALSEIEGDDAFTAPVSITVYGPATSPYVVIGNNRYKVAVDVPAGGYLKVDAIAKTITVTDAQGAVTDCFGDAERGSGLGGGSYIFEPITAGTSHVSWDNSFSFDLTVHRERGERPWSS